MGIEDRLSYTGPSSEVGSLTGEFKTPTGGKATDEAQGGKYEGGALRPVECQNYIPKIVLV